MRLPKLIKRKRLLPKRYGSCEHLDYSVMYCSDPPQYKCEYLGCLVFADSTCKMKDINGEKRKTFTNLLNKSLFP